MLKKIISTILTIGVLLGAVLGTYMIREKIAILTQDAEETEVVEQDQEEYAKANTDYSAYAEPIVDGSGMLHLPDHATISGNSATAYANAWISFSVPNRWAGNVVVRNVVRTIEKAEDPEVQLDAYVIQFFEKHTYEKYRTQEFAYEENASKMGKLTELYIVPQEANRTSIEANARELHIATITTKTGKLEVYLLQLDAFSGTSDEESFTSMSYLMDSEYAACIAKSLMGQNGTKSFPNSYMEAYALTYQADTASAEIPETYQSSVNLDVKTYEASDEMPQIEAAEIIQSYDFKAFSSPWQYVDASVQFPYAAPESGGIAPNNLTEGVIGGDANDETTIVTIPDTPTVPTEDTTDNYIDDDPIIEE
ncbi:MAG: hypothetical protein Q4B26_01470 [Eubacteriales bacterium]|nr:hypothetical protein [Eubacteriales bacterium]